MNFSYILFAFCALSLAVFLSLKEREGGQKKEKSEVSVQIAGSSKASDRKTKLSGERLRGIRRVELEDAYALSTEERMRIGFLGGDERLGILSMPRLSSGLEQKLIKKIRENMVPLGNDPKWEPRDEIKNKAEFYQAFLALGSIMRNGSTDYTPSSFWIHRNTIYIWRGHGDSPIMGYAIDREKKIRYKWRLDDLGFREFLMSPDSDNLMFEEDTEMGRRFAEDLAKRLIRRPLEEEETE